MNMYEAMKLAAAHIAAKPDLYSFSVTHIPTDSTAGVRMPNGQPYGQMGCMLGRIGAIVGYKSGDADSVSHSLLGVHHARFFDRIGHLIHETGKAPNLHYPELVAPAMLAYAELYRAELEAREWPPLGIPAEVRELFRPQLAPQNSFWSGAPKLLFGGQTVKYNVNLDAYELVT